MAAVSAHGPVSVCISADNMDFIYYTSGVLTMSGSGCTANWDEVDHCLLLVGYGTDVPVSAGGTGLEYWLLQNEWGTDWGDNGFLRIARGDNTCCILCENMQTTVSSTTLSLPVIHNKVSVNVSVNVNGTMSVNGTHSSGSNNTNSAVAAVAVNGTSQLSAPGSLPYTYLGCYVDSIHNHTFSSMLSSSLTVDVDDCAKLASKRGMTMFAMQNVGQCWGGNDVSYAKYGVSHECKIKCPGHPDNYCGGRSSNSVYMLTSPPSSSSSSSSSSPSSSLCTTVHGADHYCWQCLNRRAKCMNSYANPQTIVWSSLCPGSADDATKLVC